MLPIRIVLHPTDFSDCSRYAFQVACSLARDYGARLVLLYVAEPPTTFAGDGVMMLPSTFDLQPFRDLLKQLKPEDAQIPVERRLLQGVAAREILGVAKEMKCDLIVMGTHGRTGLGRLLMGSVAEHVVRNASCPVLTVKMPLRRPPSSEESSDASNKKVAATSH